MARSSHARYDAASKHERALARKPRPQARRKSTKQAIVRAEIFEQRDDFRIGDFR